MQTLFANFDEDLHKKCTTPKLTSIYPIGYMREQYSGSCGYNCTLLAMYFHNYQRESNISILKQSIGRSWLQDLRTKLSAGHVTLTYDDDEFVALFRHVLKDNAQNIQLLDEISAFLPAYSYPVINFKAPVDAATSEQLSVAPTPNQINSIDDIIQYVFTPKPTETTQHRYISYDIIIQYPKLRDDQINQIIEVTKRANTSDFIKLQEALYRYHDHRRNEADNFVIIYLQLCCIDKIHLSDYRLLFKNKKNAERYGDRKYNFVRNIYFNQYVTNDNLKYFTEMFEKYILFFPTSLETCIDLVTSLKSSNQLSKFTSHTNLFAAYADFENMGRF